ncbi:MAG: hypothetical protein EOM65_11790 [Synergistales bacterium]|nr:hypothetical protein [Synergistales bacterium]
MDKETFKRRFKQCYLNAICDACKVRMWNDYASLNEGPLDIIYTNDDTFFSAAYDTELDALRAAVSAAERKEYRVEDPYVVRRVDGTIRSFEKYCDEMPIDVDDLAENVYDNPEEWSLDLYFAGPYVKYLNQMD